MIKNGIPIEIIQKILGHKSLESTMIYSHLDQSDTVEAMTLVSSLINKKAKKNDNKAVSGDSVASSVA